MKGKKIEMQSIKYKTMTYLKKDVGFVSLSGIGESTRCKNLYFKGCDNDTRQGYILDSFSA